MSSAVKLFSIITLAFVFSSCQKDDVGDRLDVININWSEKPSPENLSLTFQCSGGNFDCQNVLLSYSFHRTEKAFYLDFGKSYISPGQTCYQNTGYNTSSAKAYFDVDNIPNGSYRLEVSNQDEILHAALRIDNKTIFLDNGSSETVKFSQQPLSALNRIPKDAVWGYATSNEASLPQLLDSLYSLGAVNYAPLLESGYYSRFNIVDGNITTYGYEDNDFIIKTALDTATLKNVMNSFNASLEVSTGRGYNFSIH